MKVRDLYSQMFCWLIEICENLKVCVYMYIQLIDPSTVFSTFDVDQLRKIHQDHRKKHLKISKVAKFESDRMKTNKDIAPKSLKIL